MGNKDIAYETFLNSLAKLKKNRDNVPEEVLKTKYHDAYARLRHQVWQDGIIIMQHFLIDGHFLARDINRAQEYANAIASVINDKSTGWKARMKKALWEQCDAMSYLNTCAAIQEQYEELYLKYWDSLCYTKNGQIFNELLGEEFHWDEQKKIWISPDGNSWTIRHPAPDSLRQAA